MWSDTTSVCAKRTSIDKRSRKNWGPSNLDTRSWSKRPSSLGLIQRRSSRWTSWGSQQTIVGYQPTLSAWPHQAHLQASPEPWAVFTHKEIYETTLLMMRTAVMILVRVLLRASKTSKQWTPNANESTGRSKIRWSRNPNAKRASRLSTGCNNEDCDDRTQMVIFRMCPGVMMSMHCRRNWVRWITRPKSSI